MEGLIGEMKKVISKILGKFGMGLVRTFPRHSVRFAKKYFKNKPITAIEIGSWKGENASSIFEELNVRKLYIIDPYLPYQNYVKQGKSLGNLSNAQSIAKRKLSKHKNKIIWIKNYSDNAIKEIKEKVDFVYIDGNHEYEYVKRDVENYYKKLKKGGILAGYDITHERFNRDIFKALKEFSNKTKITPYISRTDWWMVKK